MADNSLILELPLDQRQQMYQDARVNIMGNYPGTITPEMNLQIEQRLHEHFGLGTYDPSDSPVPPHNPADWPTEEQRRQWELEEADPAPAGEDDFSIDEGEDWDLGDDSSETSPSGEKSEPSDKDPANSEQNCADGKCDPSLGAIAWEFLKGVGEGLVPTDRLGWAMLGVFSGLALIPALVPYLAVLGVGMLAWGGISLWRQWDTLGTLGQARGLGQLFGSVLPFFWGMIRPKKVPKDIPDGPPPDAPPPDTPPPDAPPPDAPPSDGPPAHEDGTSGPSHPRPNRTEPTGEIGGKARGELTDIPENPKTFQEHELVRSLTRENEAGTALAENGYQVERNPGLNAHNKKPDYKIEGEFFDCYAPAKGTSPENVAKYLQNSKVDKKQAERFVLNLSDNPGLDLGSLRNILQTHYPQIREVIVVNGSSVVPFYP